MSIESWGATVREGRALRLAALAAWTFLGSEPVRSATVGHVTLKGGGEIIDLVGQIEPGDAAKLGGFVRSYLASGTGIVGLRLDSPGGDLNEALKIIDLVQNANLPTIIGNGSTCASACFAIFASGVQKYASIDARIGVHGASVKGGKETSQSQAATVRLAKILRTLGVSATVIGKMVVTPPSQIVWLLRADLESIGVTFPSDEKPTGPQAGASSAIANSTPAIALPGTQTAEQAVDPKIAEIRAMNWQVADGLKLPNGYSHIYGLQGLTAVVGSQANRFRSLIDPGTSGKIEADILAIDFTEVVYSWEATGRVSDTDWSDLDVAQMLKQIRDTTLAQNDARKASGGTYFTDVVWRDQPRLDQRTHSISWVIDGSNSDGSHTLNSVTLKLGRYGYERINVVSTPNSAQGPALVAQANSTFYFDAGARYDDFEAGRDRVAEFGVAGLVASLVGLKVAKVLGFGALLIVLKKFAALLVVPFIIAFRFIKGGFKRSKPLTSPPCVEPKVENN